MPQLSRAVEAIVEAIGHTMYIKQNFIARCSAQPLADHVVYGQAHGLELLRTFRSRNQIAVGPVVENRVIRYKNFLRNC